MFSIYCVSVHACAMTYVIRSGQPMSVSFLHLPCMFSNEIQGIRPNYSLSIFLSQKDEFSKKEN